MAQLKELVDIYLGVTHTPEYVENGVPFLSVKDISGGTICFDDCKYISEEEYNGLSQGAKPQVGDMLFCRVGTIGKPIIIPVGTPTFGSFVSLGYLRNKDDSKCCLEYLRYWMYSKAFERQVYSNVKGASQINLNTGWLSKFEVVLPDILVQEEIVKKLDKCVAVINKRKQELEELDNLIKSRFVELFGNVENKIPIGEMCNVTGGYSFKSGDISNDGAIKILQIGNVYLDNVSWETTNFLPEGHDEKYSKFLLDEGDIVVALTRPIIQSLGNVKACIVKSSDLPCLLNQRVGRIVAKNEKTVFLEFIYGCLMTNDFTRYVESCSIGCSQPNISTKDIENYMIPNATYEEQKAYVEFKTQTDKLKFEVQRSLEETQKLMDSLIQKYFG